MLDNINTVNILISRYLEQIVYSITFIPMLIFLNAIVCLYHHLKFVIFSTLICFYAMCFLCFIKTIRSKLYRFLEILI